MHLPVTGTFHSTSAATAHLQRQFSHGRSSLFYLGHDTPQPPSVTCIQGHEILPGETTCIHEHPVS